MTPPDLPALAFAMRRACDEARQWLGATSPNPAVGAAALDANGTLLAVAAHHRAGEDHAEAALLKLCHAQNLMGRLHTLCVTLEPCNHTGRTPPCSEAILATGARRVAVGVRDPNTHVKGGGCDRLRAAGLEIIENVESEMCQTLIHAFRWHAKTSRPFVTVKRAFDEHGAMIPPLGQKTFTSRSALTLAHRLRKKADALVTGSGTILADDPFFTVRHVADFPHKRRVLAILDRRGRVPARYVDEASTRGLDVQLYVDMDQCFADLEKRGARDILVESGPLLSQAVLASSHWTLSVDIHKGPPERIVPAWAPSYLLSFPNKRLDLDSLLPRES